MIFAKRRNGAPRHFRRACDKKVGALGLAALLGVPDQALPPELQAGLPQLLAGLIRLLTALKAQQACLLALPGPRSWKSINMGCCVMQPCQLHAASVAHTLKGTANQGPHASPRTLGSSPCRLLLGAFSSMAGA